MRILYVTTIGLTMVFFKALIKDLIDKGNVVDIATNESEIKVPECYREWGCKVYQISTSRSVFSTGNIKAIKTIREIAKGYDIVHCHTPVASIATRIACRKLRTSSLKVIYTAHGFHFYNDAPLKNWIIYYPIEKICSYWTDLLITINNEDYNLAINKMKAKKIKYVPGVGIDIKKIENIVIDKNDLLEKLGINENAKVVLSVGELNENKNHRVVIEALGTIADKDIHYIIAGEGIERENLNKLANQHNVNLHLLGFVPDVCKLYKLADLYIHPSYREGLPVSLMEAISTKVNCICSNIRGCSDLVSSDRFNPRDSKTLAATIKEYLFEGKSNNEENYENLQKFDINNVIHDMNEIYQEESM